jgi:hypothetical protein
VTNQEVFDRVWDYFITKGNPPAVSDEGFGSVKLCRYRTKDGRRCAIGCLIPDELYEEGLEGCPARFIPHASPALEELFAGVSTELLTRLQVKHDTCAKEGDETSFTQQYALKLRDIAGKHDLQVPD